RDDRHVQLLGECLEASADRADFLLAVLLRLPARLHELDVVDDDEPELGLVRLESTRLRPHLEHADAARVVDPDRRRVQVTCGLGEPYVVVVGEPAAQQPAEVDERLAAQHALDELLLRHLEREDSDGRLLRDRRMQAHIHAERRLAHRGTRRDDHQVTLLKAARHRIEVREAGADARYAALRGLQLLDLLERGIQDLLDPDEALALVRLRNLEDALLGDVEDLLDAALAGLVRITDDRAARLDQAAQQRALTDDLRVILDVCGGGHRIHQLGDVLEPADGLQLLGLLQLLAQRDRVDDTTLLEQARHRPEDATVRLAVEHGVVDDLDRLRHRVRVDQHAAQ